MWPAEDAATIDEVTGRADPHSTSQRPQDLHQVEGLIIVLLPVRPSPVPQHGTLFRFIFRVLVVAFHCGFPGEYL